MVITTITIYKYYYGCYNSMMISSIILVTVAFIGVCCFGALFGNVLSFLHPFFLAGI